MRSDRMTAVVVGALFIAATVASILGSVALGPALDGSDYLTRLADEASRVIPAAVLFLVAASSAFGTAILLFPILRRHAEGLAAAYVGFRALENGLYIAGTVALLTMLTVSQSDALSTTASTDTALLGAALAALHEWPVLIGTLMFAGLGSLTLNSVLYTSRLVPRWLSGWGLGGAALVVIYGLIGVSGGDTGLGSPLMLLAMPIALQEIVFAVWLITRGFHDRDATRGRTRVPRVDVMT